MKGVFGNVHIDTSKMTTKELLETQREITKLLADVKFQLRLRKMAERKHSSENHWPFSGKTLVEIQVRLLTNSRKNSWVCNSLFFLKNRYKGVLKLNN